MNRRSLFRSLAAAMLAPLLPRPKPLVVRFDQEQSPLRFEIRSECEEFWRPVRPIVIENCTIK